MFALYHIVCVFYYISISVLMFAFCPLVWLCVSVFICSRSPVSECLSSCVPTSFRLYVFLFVSHFVCMSPCVKFVCYVLFILLCLIVCMSPCFFAFPSVTYSVFPFCA